MERKNIMKDWVLFIREHRKEELSLEILAGAFGYSPYHFSRLFRETMGITAMEYVKQQRLYGAAEEILKGRRILDTALDYGYETHSGFTRAFRSQFGYSPALLRAWVVRERLEKGEREGMGLYLAESKIHEEPDVLFEELCAIVKKERTDCEEERLRAVYDLAKSFYGGRKRKSGDLYVTHPLNVAIILADMGADGDTVCAGLLHDVPELTRTDGSGHRTEEITPAMAEILTEFGKFQSGNREGCEERAVLIALADRLHNMRTIEFMDSSVWKEKARETLELFAPLAAEYGNLKCRMEFDELSLKYLKEES